MTMLQHGDCLDLLPAIPDRSIDVICTDLPYGTTRCKWDTPIDLPTLWQQYERVITDKGVILLFAQSPFDKVLACSNLPMFRYEWIWEKGTATGHLNAKKMPLKAHENILVFYKNLPYYQPQKTHGHSPVNAFYTRKSGDCYGDAAAKRSGGGNTDRYPRSVLRFPVEPNPIQSTQKPEPLVEYLLRTYAPPGCRVLDSCMGSGTTGVVCKSMGLQFTGMEKDLDNYNRAVDRLANTP